MKRESMSENIWSYINKTDSCWLWTAHINPAGYGILGGPKRVVAHRAVLLLTGTTIPKGMVVDHMCRVRHCVNPKHLRVVTRVVNSLENSVGMGAINALKQKCVRGHSLEGPHIAQYHKNRNGKFRRQCKLCDRIRAAEYRKSMRAA